MYLTEDAQEASRYAEVVAVGDGMKDSGLMEGDHILFRALGSEPVPTDEKDDKELLFIEEDSVIAWYKEYTDEG